MSKSKELQFQNVQQANAYVRGGFDLGDGNLLPEIIINDQVLRHYDTPQKIDNYANYILHQHFMENVGVSPYTPDIQLESDNPLYDYRGAYQAGIMPDEEGRFPAQTPEGKWLKSPDDPDAWKDAYKIITGNDADKLGVKFEDLYVGLQDRILDIIPDKYTPTKLNPEEESKFIEWMKEHKPGVYDVPLENMQAIFNPLADKIDIEETDAPKQRLYKELYNKLVEYGGKLPEPEFLRRTLGMSMSSGWINMTTGTDPISLLVVYL